MFSLEKFFFYLLVFCLPFQTRKIFFQWGSEFNEWTSAFFYLTDVLMLFVFLFWFWRMKKECFLKKISWPWLWEKLKTIDFWLMIFLVIGFISLIQANNFPLGLYQWFKLLEMVILFFYLKSNLNYLINFRRLIQILVVSGLGQAVIAIIQYSQQKSLGLKFFAESPLNLEINGVAKIFPNGLEIIRAYGLLPHPNLLAAFLLVSIFCVYFLWLSREHSLGGYLWLFLALGLLIFALWLTFSRVAITAFLLVSLIYFVFSFCRRFFSWRPIISLFFLLVMIVYLLTWALWPEISSRWDISLSDQSVTLRQLYNQIAFRIIKNYPWLGFGLGQFVWEMKQGYTLLANWMLQPVHNLYLLIAVEMGLAGLIVFLFFVLKLLRQGVFLLRSERSFLFFIFLCFLFIAFFDHFFWTLQQGQLMFWLVSGLMASRLVQKEKVPGSN